MENGKSLRAVFRWFGLALMACLVSCKPEVNIYADYEQVPIIYGLLDANADTNYIKITRGFYAIDNVDQIALNPDSSDYPGKLDVRLYEYCNGDSIREIILDTITIHNKTAGAFYAPHQKLYYTDVPLPMNTYDKQYHYKLKVVLPDRVLTAETDMVGNPGFDAQSLGVDFSRMYYYGASRPFLFHPAMNAAFYEVSFSFTFLEQRTPEADSVPRTMHWPVGYYSTYDLSLAMQNGCFVFWYRSEPFYKELEELLGADTAIIGLTRYIEDYPVEVIIAAGGEELRQYVHNNSGVLGMTSGSNEYSLINGGCGVFSSRMTVRHKVRLAGETVPDLLAETKWGFRFIGGGSD